MKTVSQQKSVISIWGLFKLLLWLFVLIPLRAVLAATQPQATYKATNNTDNNDPNSVCAILPQCPEFKLVQYTQDASFFNTIFLGENHKFPSTTAACIEKLTAEHLKHTIYLQGVAADQKTSCADFGISNKAGRTCIGWDNMEEHNLFERSNMIHRIYTLMNIQEKQQALKLSDKLFDTYLQDIQNYLQLTNKLYDKQLSTAKQMSELEGKKVLLTTIKSVLKQREQSNETYKDIITNRLLIAANNLKDPNKAKALAAKIKKSCHARNEWLINALASKPRDTFAVFLAGVHRVKAKPSPYDPDTQDACDAEYVQQELKRGENGNPYAILAMVK